MIVLDTNVVSETMRLRPDGAVTAWLDQQDWSNLYLSSVVIAEMKFGGARLPAGQRRISVLERIDLLVHQFDGRILPFDLDATTSFAEIASHRASVGRPIEFADAQIAAICRLHRATLATRNVRDFEECGIDIANPWSSAESNR